MPLSWVPSSQPSGIPPASSAAGSANPAEAREARKTMTRIERQLTKLGEREGKLHEEMAAEPVRNPEQRLETFRGSE